MLRARSCVAPFVLGLLALTAPREVCIVTVLGFFVSWFGLVFAGVFFLGLRRCVFPGFALASAVWLARFTRRPCAGRHLLSLPPQRK
jgi:hypothetical protein